MIATHILYSFGNDLKDCRICIIYISVDSISAEITCRA